MDTSEIIARVREWLSSAQTTLSFIWRTRKVIVIAVFVLLSVGLVVWARFGFTVEYSRFFAAEIDEGCTSDFPKKTQRLNDYLNELIPFVRLDPGDTFGCENSLGQVNLFPTEFPQCLVVGVNENRYEEWIRLSVDHGRTFIFPNGEIGSGLPSPFDLPFVPDPLFFNPFDFFLGFGGASFHHRYLVAEAMVMYNNCTWDVAVKAAYPGSFQWSITESGLSIEGLDIPSDASWGTEPTDFQTFTIPSCAGPTGQFSACFLRGFEIELDTAAANCGRVAAEVAFEHQIPSGVRYSWFSYEGEELSQDGAPSQPPPRGFVPVPRTAVPRSSNDASTSIYSSARLSDYLFAVVHREPGQNLNDIDVVPTEKIAEGKRVNVFSYLRSCTGAPGERRPETRGDVPGTEIPGVTCSDEPGQRTCSGGDVFQHFIPANGLPACPGTVTTTCPSGCTGGDTGEAVCKSATDGGNGGDGGGPIGGGNTGTASCEEIEFCPAGTVGLGAARNGSEFVDDSNLGWFDFDGGSLTLVCGPGLGGRAGTVYVGPPPPRRCPDGRSIPNSGNYRTLRATNISNFCFGDPQASFDINFLNPRHVIDCSQHEVGYSETFDLPQGQWFFGAIGPGTSTAAACIPGSSGGSSGGQTCDGDGSSCPDPSGTPQAANLSVTCGETSNTIMWQNPQSLGAVVNSVLRDVNGQGNEFVFAEGGCYTSYGISSYTDTDVSPGNTYAYRVKTGANVASNTVICEPADVTPTPVSTTPPPGPTTPPPPPGAVCGDGTCSGGETCSICADDCGTCGASCGDGICSSGESCSSCASDCGACSATCGDNICGAGETCSICADDCGTCGATCGDGICDNSESCSVCANDCGVCGVSRVGPAGQTPTGPGEATLLAFMLAGLTAFLYVSYTHTSLFRRREIEDIQDDQEHMDFRA